MKLKTLLATGLTIISLHGQEPPTDPFRTPKTVNAPARSEPANISICYEAFSLPLAMAAKLQRQQLGDSELYKQLVAAVEKNTARQETFVMLRAKSGQKATTESVSETIYPTDFEPPKLPGSTGVATTPPDVKNQPTPAPAAQNPSGTPIPFGSYSNPFPATPCAFETRNVGSTLEIEPTLGWDDKVLDVRLVPEIVTLVGRSSWGQGLSTTEMPTFESQRLNMAFSAQVNQPFLLGTISRPPVSTVDPDSANRVWFAFVTGTLAKP